MPGMDIIDIKRINYGEILDAVRFEDGITKRDIAQKTSLSLATVSNLCNELIQDNILCTTKDNTVSVGRTPNNIRLNYNGFNLICLNLQMKDVMGFAVLNLRKEATFHQDYDIAGLQSPEEIIAYAKQIFDQEVANREPSRIFIGIGVAVSSIYDIVTHHLVNSAIEMFDGVPLKDMVERYFGLPAYIDNEANLCALSVKTEKNSNIVYLHVSEGVGVGIVSQGHLLRGENGYGGEIAHMPIGNRTIECPTCHNFGCVEPELAIPGFVFRYFGNGQPNVSAKWREYVGKVRDHEEKAVQLVQDSAVLLGKLVSVLINLFDPEIVYVGGDISQVYPTMEHPFLREVAKRCPALQEKGLQIICDPNSSITINTGIAETIYKNWKIMEQ